MSKLFRLADQDYPVSVREDQDGYRVVSEGREWPWTVRQTGEAWAVDTPEGRQRLFVLVTPDACHVFHEGRVHVFAKPDPEQDAADDAGSAGPRLTADMPGKVVKVLVSVGDTVTVGQVLVIMESMKMETELSATVGGTVAKVDVTAGQVVGQGDLLVEITPEDLESSP